MAHWWILLAAIVVGEAAKAQDTTGAAPEPAPSATQPPPTAPSAGEVEHSIVPIPVVYYTPETELAGGAAVVYRFGRPGEKASSLMPLLVYTKRRQRIADVKWSQYYDGGEWHTQLNYRGTVYPDKFFGISNATEIEAEEEFTLQNHYILADIEQRQDDESYAGIAVRHHQYKVTERVDGGLLETIDPPGADGARLNGIGPRLTYDTRDNAFSARDGSHHELSIIRFWKQLGSTSTLTEVELAARRYVSFTPVDVGTFEFRFQGREGEVPLGELAKLGGTRNMRGYFQGRYQDRNALSLQTEYRRHLWKMLWGAAFYGLGTVADGPEDLFEQKFRHAGGGGLRVVLDPKARTTIRVDYGRGYDQKGLYFGINEAW